MTETDRPPRTKTLLFYAILLKIAISLIIFLVILLLHCFRRPIRLNYRLSFGLVVYLALLVLCFGLVNSPRLRLSPSEVCLIFFATSPKATRQSNNFSKSLAKSPSIKAEWLENEVWKRISEIIDDPNRLMSVISDTIENLKLKEADLSARIRPIDERLSEIAEQKARLADEWVIRHMNTDKFKDLKENLDKEEARIRVLRVGIDPAQIQELESTKGVLRFWETQIRSMAWNTENEDGSMVRQVDGPHQVSLKIIGFEDKELSNILGFPASKREMLNKLQVKLTVFSDKIEVNSFFPVEPISIQKCTSTGLR